MCRFSRWTYFGNRWRTGRGWGEKGGPGGCRAAGLSTWKGRAEVVERKFRSFVGFGGPHAAVLGGREEVGGLSPRSALPR